MEAARNLCYNWGPNADDKLAATGKFFLSGAVCVGLAHLTRWHMTVAAASSLVAGLATAHFFLYCNRTATSTKDQKIGYDNAWRLNGKFSMLSLVTGQLAGNLLISALVLKTQATTKGLFSSYSRANFTFNTLSIAAFNIAFLGGLTTLCARNEFQPRLTKASAD